MLIWMLSLAVAVAQEDVLDSSSDEKKSGAVRVDSRTALVAPFFPVNPSAEEGAERIPEILLEYLGKNNDINALPLTDMKDIHDQDPLIYMLSCPQNEFAGCAMVVAENTGIPYAVTGKVTALGSGYRVEVHFIDVVMGREALTVNLDIAEGAEDIFAETISRSLLGVMRGVIGQDEDIRSEEEESILDPDAAKELATYTQSTGGVDNMEERIDLELERKKLTKDDIYLLMEEEGSKEWDRMNLKPMEYLKFYNSGTSIREWRDLARGRKGSIILRGALGFGNGPTHGAFFGRTIQDDSYVVIEAYSWQTLVTDTGARVRGSAGYGLTPFIDVSVVTGVATGRYKVDFHRRQVGGYSVPPPAYDFANNLFFYGGEVIATVPSLVPDRYKPIVGFDTIYLRNETATSYLAEFPPDGLPELEAPVAVMSSVILGGEMRLSKYLDFYMHFPLSFMLFSSNAPSTYRQNGGNLQPEDYQKPDDHSLFGWNCMVGMQTKIPVVKKSSSMELEF